MNGAPARLPGGGRQQPAARRLRQTRSPSEYDNLKLVRSQVNLGFAGGNMYGMQFAKARYYYFLNNDCLLLNDCLGVLYAFCENNPRVGLCSGQMYDEHEKLQLTFGADPYSLLDYMKGKLRPGGVVVSSIPNIHYFRALIEIIWHGQWRYTDVGTFDKTHLRFFTRKSIVDMYRDTGYRVLRMEGTRASKSIRPFLLNLLFLGKLSDNKYLQFATVATPA